MKSYKVDYTAEVKGVIDNGNVKVADVSSGKIPRGEM